MLHKIKDLMHNKGFIELAKYGVFGCITTGINLGLFFIMTKAGMYYLLSNSLSYCIAVVVNYIFNYRYVFHDKGEKQHWKWKEFFKFFLVRLGSLLADNTLFFILVSLLHVNVYVARIGLSIAVILATYVVNKLFVFKKSTPSDSDRADRKFTKDRENADKI